MVVIKHKGLPFEETEGMSRVLGKRVYAQDGTKLGHVGEIHLDPKQLTVEGVTIEKSIFATPDYVGKNYIDSITKEGVLLKINPITELLNKRVIDSEAKKIGYVKDVVRSKKTNNVVALTVDRPIGKRDLIITNREIKNIGESVVLNTKIRD